MAESFTAQTRLAVDRMIGATEQQVRGTILQVSRNIIMATPVGDPTLWKSSPPPGYVGGSLRAGWNASIGNPDYAISSQTDRNGSRTVADASRVLDAFQLGNVFYLANPLPYAMRVEFGSWSQQAPQGMLRRAVINANQQIGERFGG